MVRTVADGPMPAMLRPGPSMAVALTTPEREEDEAREPEIAAEPPLDRSVFAYMQARKGIDAEQYFGNCASCQNFVPEAFGRGAFRGARCQLFGSNFPISDDDGCNHWMPWPDGTPCDHCVSHAAQEMVAGCRGSVSPWAAGYAVDKRRVCATCRQFDAEESECRFFEHLNQTCSTVFMLDTKIVAPAKCSAWSAIPEMNDDG